MAMDPRIKAGIFAGESGGDYNALFGYQNRKPGAPQVSQMTVGQVMDFTNPRGGYGQGVKRQIGRVATPVGAYQIVGTTLRDAVNKLGIDPNTPFNKETQDRLGDYILKTQGTRAWEGYKGPRAPGSYSAPNGARASTKGRQMPSNWERIIAASQQQKRGGPKDMLAAGLMAFAQNAPRMYRGEGMSFGGGGPSRRQTNATVAWLQEAGRPDLAAAVAAGALPAGDAINLSYSQPSQQKGIEVDGRVVNPVTGEVIYDGGGSAPGYRPLTPEEAAQYPGLDPKKAYQIDEEGKISAIGGGGVNVNVGDKLTEGQAKNVLFHTMITSAKPVLEQYEHLGAEWASMTPTFLKTDEGKAYDAAASLWAEGFLRATSGATITPEDIEVNKRSFFPRPGDPPSVVENKRKAREEVEAALLRGTGPGGAQQTPDALPPSDPNNPDPLGLR